MRRRTTGRDRRRHCGHARPAAAALAAMATVLLAGCFEVTDELTINPDGSGKVRIVTKPTAEFISSMGMVMMSRMGNQLPAKYPPMMPQQAGALFSDKFQVKVTPQPGYAGATIEATFKKIDALLGSPYAEAHSLSLVRSDGRLTLKARSGLQGAAAVFEMAKTPTPLPMMGMDLAKLAENVKDLKYTFKVTLPGDAAIDNGPAATAAEGHTVTWTVDCPGAADPAQAAKALDEVLTAHCPDAGVSFEPKSLPWLNLLTFDQVEARAVGEAPAAIDVEKVRAASRFVPTVLRVVRSFDFTGEGFHGENGAGLTGVVVVPREFEPQYFGASHLKTAVDDLGNNLVPTEPRRVYRSYSDRYVSFGDNAPSAPAPNVLHRVDFELKVPPFDAKTLVRIEGAVDLHYGGQKRLMRFPGAVTKGQVRDVGSDAQAIMRMMYNFGDENAGHPLKASIVLRDAARVGGLTLLQLGYDRTVAKPIKIQVYDAAGRPVPGLPLPSAFSYRDENTKSLVLLGRLEGPISLAVLVEEAGPKVELPVVLTDVPITEEKH